MFQIVLQSFVRAEVTIGIILSVLLISGRSEPKSIAFSLGGIGVFLLIYGLLPLTRKQRTPSTTATGEAAESPSTEEESTTTETTRTNKLLSRRDYVLRAVVMSFLIIGTAFLIYWLSPDIPV